MITIGGSGDFSKVTRYLEKLNKTAKLEMLDKYGRKCVDALSKATPVDSGLTATSWYYEVEHQNGLARINLCNSNINKGVPIAIVLQYGHGTGTGGWVEGRDYINPAIQPIFDQIVEDAWREIKTL